MRQRGFWLGGGVCSLWSILACGVLAFQAPSSRAQPTPPRDVWGIDVSKDSKFLTAGAGWWDQPGEICVWDLVTRKPLRRFSESLGVASVAFSTDGKLLASGSWNGHVRVRDWAEGSIVADFAVKGVARVAFSPQGQLLATATESKTVQLWDPTKPDPLADLAGDLFRFHCVAFSPDGKRVAAGGGDWKFKGIAQVTIWDVASRQQVLKLVGHDNAIICLAFSPKGDQIATGAIDGTARLWDAETGAQVKIFPGHANYIESVIFTRDGKTLLTGCRDGKIRFWNLASGLETGRIEAPTSSAHLYLCADDRHLLAGGIPGTLKLYDDTTRQEVATFWDGSNSPIAQDDLPEMTPPKGRRRGSLTGVVVAGFLLMTNLLVLFYAWRRRRSAAVSEARSTWLRVEIGAFSVAILLFGVTVVLLLFRLG